MNRNDRNNVGSSKNLRKFMQDFSFEIPIEGK